MLANTQAPEPNSTGHARMVDSSECPRWQATAECSLGRHCRFDHPPIKAVFCEGELKKRSSGLVPMWQKRYFVLTSKGMAYAKSPALVMNAPIYGWYDIIRVQSIDVHLCRFMVVYVQGRSFVLEAPDRKSYTAWLKAFNDALFSIRAYRDPKLQSAKRMPLKLQQASATTTNKDLPARPEGSVWKQPLTHVRYNLRLLRRHWVRGRMQDRLMAVFRVISIVVCCAFAFYLLQPFVQCYLDLGSFAKKAEIQGTRKIIIPSAHDADPNLNQTSQSIQDWHASMLKLWTEVIQNTALEDCASEMSEFEIQQASDIEKNDNQWSWPWLSHLIASDIEKNDNQWSWPWLSHRIASDIEKNDDQWSWPWLSHLIVLSFALLLALHLREDLIIGFLTLVLNFLLLLMMYRAKGTNDALMDNVEQLQEASLKLVQLKGLDSTSQASLSFLIQKLEMFIKFWSSRSLGVTVVLPFEIGFNLNTNFFLTYSLINCAE
eukprot:g44260.t1